MTMPHVSMIERLDAERIRASLPEGVRLAGLSVHAVIDSTNGWLRERSHTLPAPYVCVSEHQLAGRGRRGRTWVDGEGRDICLSMLWRFDTAKSRAQGLSLAIGVAAARALAATGAAGIGLKWPNDIVWQDCKLGGILIEGTVSGRIWTVVIGVGINLHPEPGSGAPGNRAYLASLPGSRVFRNSLAAGLVAEIWTECMRFDACGAGPAIAEWRALDAMLGRPVRVHRACGDTVGVACGVDDAGELLVDVDGARERFVSVEVSLRPDPSGPPGSMA